MWVNLSSDTGMGWTFTLGCFVTLAARHAWQSLHQAAMSLDMPCQTTFLQSSPLIACGPGWAVCTCLAMPGSPSGSGHSRGQTPAAFSCPHPAPFSAAKAAPATSLLDGMLHRSLGRELFLLQRCYSRGLLAGANSCRVELTSSARIILVSLRSPCRESILNSLHWLKKKIKFSLYIRKFRMEQLQSHMWLTASSYLGKYLRVSSYIRKHFLIYDFATAPLWISSYMRKIWLSFLSV